MIIDFTVKHGPGNRIDYNATLRKFCCSVFEDAWKRSIIGSNPFAASVYIHSYDRLANELSVKFCPYCGEEIVCAVSKHVKVSLVEEEMR